MLRGWSLAVPVVACTVAVLGTGDALARGEDKSWEFGAYAAFSRHSNESLIDEDIGFGVRGAYYFRAARALEVTVDKEEPDSTVDGSKFDVTKTLVHYVQNWAPKRNEKLSPYLTFGAGLLTAEVTGRGPVSAEDSSTILQAGGGARYFYGKHVGLRVDGRASYWHGEGVATPRESYFTFDLTVGVTILWKGGT